MTLNGFAIAFLHAVSTREVWLLHFNTLRRNDAKVGTHVSGCLALGIRRVVRQCTAVNNTASAIPYLGDLPSPKNVATIGGSYVR